MTNKAVSFLSFSSHIFQLGLQRAWILQLCNGYTLKKLQEKPLFLARRLRTGTPQDRKLEVGIESQFFSLLLSRAAVCKVPITKLYFCSVGGTRPKTLRENPPLWLEKLRKGGPHESMGGILLIFSLFYFTALSWRWIEQGKCMTIWGG